jgi:hypothetical protein
MPVRDAILTPKGQEQCRELDELSQKNIQQKAELIVSSPVSFPPQPEWTAMLTIVVTKDYGDYALELPELDQTTRIRR